MMPRQTQTHRNVVFNLPQQNAALYKELKQRQMEYINLIRDLHHQNHRLRQMLQTQDFLYRANSPQNYHHTKTPSFNSAKNSRSNSQKNQNKIILKQQAKIFQRFSFADKNEDCRPIIYITTESQFKKDEQCDNQPKISPHDCPETLNQNNKSKQIFAMFRNFLRPSNKPGGNYEELNKITEHSQSLQQNNQCPYKTIQSKVSKQKLWKIKTNKSIRGGQSRTSDNRLDFGDDQVSQYSLVCQMPKFSPNKLNSLMDHQVPANSPERNYIPEKQFDQQDQKNSGNSMMYKSNLKTKKHVKIKNDEYLSIQTDKYHPKVLKKYQKIETFEHLSSPRNRNKINNKIYL